MEGPLRFTPFLRPMVWGGQRLREALGKDCLVGEKYGESWEISDHVLHRSMVASSYRHGQTLRHLMEVERLSILGEAAEEYETFPWLVKLLDACDWLSVQVHPDTEAVKRLWPGEGSKTEAWFVLDAKPDSRIYAGLLPGVDEARLRSALNAGTVGECLHQFTPRAGDCIFLPAGTVHAVGGGVLMAEVQQTSDATFRLFDWNRKDAHGKARTLHVEEAMAAIHWDRGPVEPIRIQGYGDHSAAPVRQTLVECPFFLLDYERIGRTYSWGGMGGVEVAVILGGQGQLVTRTMTEPLRAGQAWLLPSSAPACRLEPEPTLELLLCRLPE